MVKLGDVCRFINGDRGKNYPSQADISVNGEVPFINAGHLVDGKIDFSEMNYISQKKFEQLNSGKIQENDILYCLRGSLGKKAIVKEIHKGAIASSLVIIRPNLQKLNSDYLFYALESPTVQEQMMQANNGSSQPNLSAKSVSDYTFNLPDIDVQLETVSRLSKVNELITLRKEQLAKLDGLVKSRFIELFGDIANGPKYSSVPLGTICSTLSGGTPTTRFPEYYQGDIPWISTPYLGNNHINGSSAKAYITEAAIKNSATHLIPANTIMFGIRVGVGKSSIIDEPMCANQDIVALMDIDTSKYNLLFIKHVLDGYQSHFDSIKKGATILGITTDDLKKVMIPMVGIELQNQFAAFVEQTDKSKLAIQQSLDKLELLKKSLMQEYFG